MPRNRLLLLPLLLALAAPSAAPIVFNDDGGWCWFQDERVIVLRDKLIIGSVASGRADATRRGNVEVVSYDIATGRSSRAVLRAQFLNRPNGPYDDHNAAAFAVRPDGRLIAVYATHGTENRFYYRIGSRPGDATGWGPERFFAPSESSRVTYSNLHWLAEEAGGRLYNFFRGQHGSFKPSYAFSDDSGETWVTGGVVIDVPLKFRHRPYVRYASNGRDTVHMLYTDGHPRDFDNSLYHIIYRDGQLRGSSGKPIRALKEGLKDPSEGTRIFAGNPNNVAWSSDIHLDGEGLPYVAYSVQKDSAGLPPKQGGQDHRYRYARWDGKRWKDSELAHAGTRLYAGEDDYTGNIALHPDDPDTVFISTNADPLSGKALLSKTDGKRHWEIYRGSTLDGGATWSWTAVTANSSHDNIRPIVPAWKKERTILLWLRGVYHTYTNYSLEVVGQIE